MSTTPGASSAPVEAKEYQRRPMPMSGFAASVISDELSVSDKPHHELVVDGHRVPYIRLVDITTDWNDFDPAAVTSSSLVPSQVAAVRRGERIFSLTLDNRYGLTCTESELENWGWFLANAMAVAAGYTSHGEHSRPLNRHGPSLR